MLGSHAVRAVLIQVIICCVYARLAPGAQGTGFIDREVWSGIGGTAVADLTTRQAYPDSPDETDQLTQFEAPTNIGDNYGQRIIGYLVPVTSGWYTFWIASDDAGQLWLSTDAVGDNAVLIASVPSWTSPRDYEKFSSQQSAAIHLAAGQMYFIMALQKEGGGGDNLSVAWRGPDSPIRSVIAGSFLMPYHLPDEDLLGHWAMDDNAGASPADSAPAANHGTVVGEGFEWRAGHTGVDGALYTDANTHVVVPFVDAYRTTGAFSLAAWVKIDSPQPRGDIVAMGATGPRLQLTPEGRQAVFTISDDGVVIQASSAPTIDNKQWHHVAGTYDGTVLRLYVDGMEVRTKSLDADITIDASDVIIGRNLVGAVDDLRFYRRTLSLDEINGMLAEDSPFPDPKIPENPRLHPAVVTAGGQRLLLNDTNLVVSYSSTEGKVGAAALTTNQPGWWAVNYPLGRIRGLESRSDEDISQLLFDQPYDRLRNWYIHTPGDPKPEPPVPTGPAPIDMTAQASIVVDNRHVMADDSNSGTRQRPLATITEAVRRAQAGDVIHVYPGLYREVVDVTKSGDREHPIILEGVRVDGEMPVITGNDPFGPHAWKPVTALPGVYRADILGDMMGTVSRNGVTLIERSLPSELASDEFCYNRASKEFLNLRFDGAVDPTTEPRGPGDQAWTKVYAGADGYIDLYREFGSRARNAVFWVSSYVWVAPATETWNPDYPEPITGTVTLDGKFRGYRQTGTKVTYQLNKYRLWVNGSLLPSCLYCTKDNRDYYEQAHYHRNWKIDGDVIRKAPFKAGWNRLLMQLDTTSQIGPNDLRFKIRPPEGTDYFIASATEPPEQDIPTGNPQVSYISECMISGPYPDPTPDRGIYVRLPGDANPNSIAMDQAVRKDGLVNIYADFVHFRGFEVRHGAQFQQRHTVNVFGQGCLVEGNLVRDMEFGGISVLSARDGAYYDQTAAPTIVRGNWILNPGNTGIATNGSSEYLTQDNQNTEVPGRMPFIIEHNVITNPNWTGIQPFWASGGMKVFRLTGSVIRYNHIIGGTGPGIWLDWEHFNNRIEGNFLENGWGYLVGVEASPGPHLIANNLSVNLRPAEVWFRWALLSWNSARNWAINNTIDGRWNNAPAWQNKTGADGIRLGSQDFDRDTWWPNNPGERFRTNVLYNNLILGCDQALVSEVPSIDQANYTDRGTGANATDPAPRFRNADRYDYRLVPDHTLATAGYHGDRFTGQVRHDYFGLLRFDKIDGRSVGAFRNDAQPAGSGPIIELELTDGRMIRIGQWVKTD